MCVNGRHAHYACNCSSPFAPRLLHMPYTTMRNVDMHAYLYTGREGYVALRGSGRKGLCTQTTAVSVDSGLLRSSMYTAAQHCCILIL